MWASCGHSRRTFPYEQWRETEWPIKTLVVVAQAGCGIIPDQDGSSGLNPVAQEPFLNHGKG
ncbi:hypothetical protein MAE02_60600 [Microvirga aerophila]|uniref:Uncharacterized protein n=1 Tax=Microvirga aerophila TaxID=670291 RepID=A0A512C2C2_9HYPH|nr:hypothetical protein MAE02_60600 [Microvirga aerophila]